MRVTIKDIAKKANVTPMTVSLSLRNRPGVGTKKRAEIHRLAKQMGYRPDIFGRGLQGNSTQSLGILWALSGPHAPQIAVRELTLRALRREYFSYVVDSLGDPMIFDRTLEDFARRRVDGVIVQYNQPKKIESRLTEFAAAVVICPDPVQLRVDCIHQDRLVGIRQSAQYLLSRGRRRPLFLYHNEVNRFKGEAFLAEFEQHGVTRSMNNALEVPSLKDEEIIGFLDSEFSTRRFEYDAVFCHADEISAILMLWLRSRGIRVPDDVAVVGFNDSDYCRWVTPTLASIHRNDEMIVEMADEFFFSRLKNPDLPLRNVTVPMKFVPRESAG